MARGQVPEDEDELGLLPPLPGDTGRVYGKQLDGNKPFDIPVFKCRGCGKTDNTVEISFVPRIFGMDPGADGKPVPGDFSIDEEFVENEHPIGFGCYNEECEFWCGNYQYGDSAKAIEEVAEVVMI